MFVAHVGLAGVAHAVMLLRTRLGFSAKNKKGLIVISHVHSLSTLPILALVVVVVVVLLLPLFRLLLLFLLLLFVLLYRKTQCACSSDNDAVAAEHI